MGVVGTFDRPVSLGRNDRLAAGLCDPVAEVIGVLTLIGDGGIRDEAFDQIMREGDVVALAWRTDQPNRIAKRIASSVDFRAQSAARPAQPLGIGPPFSVRAPAAC